MAKLQIRVDDDTKAKWLLKAEEQGTTLTALIISAVEGIPAKRKRRQSGIEPELLRELAMIGNNLNQIAKWANRHKTAVDAAAVIFSLIEIDRELVAFRKIIDFAGGVLHVD